VDVTSRTPNVTALALRWVALEPSTAIQAMLRLGLAQNYAEFREALTAFDAPSQSFVYADVAGNIGYQMPGKVPIRARGDGSLPVPGWTDAYEWVGYVPYDDLPRAYNPKQGYVATANQPVVGAEYPYLLSYVADVDKGYRASRIVELLEAADDDLTIEEVARIQGDDQSVSAIEVISYLGGIPLEDPELLAARDRLLAWDGQMHMDSPEGTLYGYFWMALVRRTFGDQLPEELWPGHSHAQGIVYHLLQDREDGWWDDIRTPERETREEILASALADGYSDARRELGKRPERWAWGSVHTATFANQTLGGCGIGLIEGIFNRGPVAAGGGTGILNATSWKLTSPFAVNSVPSMRQIIDLGELSNSRMMHTTGQSGHPVHRHYDDLIDPWRTVQYHPTLWARAEVEAQAEAHLRLLPRK
ncbi:MAG: penicillin acylase family protein, partial [Anaerolineae bacterium]|nr:penicillin acylase family protein [Anaerolineae bacterium]